MRQVFPKIITHITAWLAFISLPALTFPSPPDNMPRPAGLPQSTGYWFFAGLNLMLVIFFYLNYFVLIPRLLRQGKRGQYLMVVIFIFSILLGAAGLLHCFFVAPKMQSAGMDHGFFRSVVPFSLLIMFSLAWAVSSGVRLNSELTRVEERRRESENARLTAELTQLKNQLNPHFLFNTLNGIYTLTLAKSDAAPDAILKISHLLRYVIAETNTDFGPFEKDLEHLRHFIELHQMRLTDKTQVTFKVAGDPSSKQIAPLLLLPFVENAFKYGSSTRMQSPIDISLKIWENTIVFTCENYIRNQEECPTGLGIANTRRRLDLLYPERYTLDIKENTGLFNVHLTLQTG